jgi:hypothetical protein
MADLKKVKDTLEQYEEGAVTYCEFVNQVLQQVTERDRADFVDLFNTDCPY